MKKLKLIEKNILLNYSFLRVKAEYDINTMNIIVIVAMIYFKNSALHQNQFATKVMPDAVDDIWMRTLLEIIPEKLSIK